MACCTLRSETVRIRAKCAAEDLSQVAQDDAPATSSRAGLIAEVAFSMIHRCVPLTFATNDRQLFGPSRVRGTGDHSSGPLGRVLLLRKTVWTDGNQPSIRVRIILGDVIEKHMGNAVGTDDTGAGRRP